MLPAGLAAVVVGADAESEAEPEAEPEADPEATAGAGSGTGGDGGGAAVQPTSKPRIHGVAGRRMRGRTETMWLILLEALGALLVLGLIVWWVMFAGRRKGERRDGGE